MPKRVESKASNAFIGSNDDSCSSETAVVKEKDDDYESLEEIDHVNRTRSAFDLSLQ